MTQVASRAFITINGESMEIVAKSAKFTPGGISSSPVVADSGRVFSSDEPKPGMCGFTLIMTPGNKFESVIRTLRDGTVVFQWDTGETYTITSATAHEAGDWEWGPEGLECKIFGNKGQPS